MYISRLMIATIINTTIQNSAGLVDALEAITACIQQVQQTLARMGEGCDPTIYYKRVRKYMGGWRNNPRLPRGLVYGSHGVKEFYGETGVRFFGRLWFLRTTQCMHPSHVLIGGPRWGLSSY